ncbi:sigma-54 dependent transcriptional regulator [Chitinibacter sp. SCUT-21]|uniref:sigma-54-dependent transcriptional regulator n=1 Tax=Chitinibacter sp. SCUT-21 TaxID=2970891 RepID=UPI0035A63C0C
MQLEHAQVLLIDDDADVRESAQKILNHSRLPCYTLSSAAPVLELALNDWPGVIVSDICMPGMDGEQLLEALRHKDEQLPVILITGHGDIPMAIRAVRAGAFEFLEKPVAPDVLIECIHRALSLRQEIIENRNYLKHELSERLLGNSVAMTQAREKLMHLVNSDLSIFIVGEAGTGRRTVAEQLHRLGRSKDGPLVWLDAELVNDVPHSDQSAIWREQYWSAAQGGTLLISNPERLPQRLQTLLCNCLLESDPYSVNGRKVRTLTISTSDPKQAVSEGRLRPDLYYALSTATVHIPPLRQRREDIPQLFRYFVQQSCRRMKKPRIEIKKAFVEKLQQGEWSGNLRELRNVADMYAIGLARIDSLNRAIPINAEQNSLDEQIDEFEKNLIEEALSLFQGKINEAADYLHIPRKKLYLRMKKHDLDKKEYKP